MAVRAVIFDWGGTLTPWHSIDLGELWLAVCARHYPAQEAAEKAAAVRAAELELWREGERSHQSSTMQRVFERAGVAVSDDFLASYFEAWLPHTLTDPDVLPLLRELRRRGIKVTVVLDISIAPSSPPPSSESPEAAAAAVRPAARLAN